MQYKLGLGIGSSQRELVLIYFLFLHECKENTKQAQAINQNSAFRLRNKDGLWQ